MTKRLRPLLAVTLALIVAGAATSNALAGRAAPRAHAANSYLTGLGDEQTNMFGNPLWQQLHTKIARYIAPYDAALRKDSLARAKAWIELAEEQHVQILVAFYHSQHTPTKLPSVGGYEKAIAKFIKLFPNVRQYQSWNEANRGNVPHLFTSPSAKAAAQYYRALRKVCKGCTAIGLDVLDAQNISPTLRYISQFRHEVARLHQPAPRVWGLHNYSDVNRKESWRTKQISRAFGGGQVWLTETGGVVLFGGAFPNRHGSGLKRAAAALKYMFSLASSQSQLKRLYIYDWTGGTSSTRFDAGLTDAHNQPRAGYVVVCKKLRASACNVKVSRR
jgi:hypothetical protein